MITLSDLVADDTYTGVWLDPRIEDARRCTPVRVKILEDPLSLGATSEPSAA
jgi:hypothetical protein